MTKEQAVVIAFTHKGPVHCCDPSQCESIAEMHQSLDLLQRKNQELQTTLTELEHLASTDRLTGAWNRRRLEEAVGNEMDRLKRYDHPLSLLLLDVDFFKRVNDRYGHAAGDQLLVELSAQIRSALRASDSLTRWGGEEFVVLCPDTARSTMAVFAERLRRAVARMSFAIVERVTVSIGAAECLPGETWEQWFHRADAMLLRAKALGRNRVQVAPEVPQRSRLAPEGAAHFVQLVWHRAYACGHELVDREHQRLFRDTNELLAAILAGQPARETGAIVDALIRDVAQHFLDEELLIAGAGYPGAAGHAAIHRNLAERAGALAKRFRAGEVQVGEMFQFLAHDVIAGHLLGADRDFFPYLGPRAAISDFSET